MTVFCRNLDGGRLKLDCTICNLEEWCLHKSDAILNGQIAKPVPNTLTRIELPVFASISAYVTGSIEPDGRMTVLYYNDTSSTWIEEDIGDWNPGEHLFVLAEAIETWFVSNLHPDDAALSLDHFPVTPCPSTWHNDDTNEDLLRSYSYCGPFSVTEKRNWLRQYYWTVVTCKACPRCLMRQQEIAAALVPSGLQGSLVQGNNLRVTKLDEAQTSVAHVDPAKITSSTPRKTGGRKPWQIGNKE